MCSSTWFLWFFLSLDCPVNTDNEEMYDLSPWYAFNQQRVLRKGRTDEKKSISFSTVPTTGEFVFINTRFFCVAFLGRRFDSFVWELSEIPLFWCVLFWVNWKKPNQSTFFAKTYDYTRAHFCSPHFVRRRWRPRMIRVRMRDNENNGNKYVTSFSLFLFWTTMMPW